MESYIFLQPHFFLPFVSRQGGSPLQSCFANRSISFIITRLRFFLLKTLSLFNNRLSRDNGLLAQDVIKCVFASAGKLFITQGIFPSRFAF